MSTLTDIADELKQISDYAAEAKAIRMMQAEMIDQLRKVKENQSNHRIASKSGGLYINAQDLQELIKTIRSILCYIPRAIGDDCLRNKVEDITKKLENDNLSEMRTGKTDV